MYHHLTEGVGCPPWKSSHCPALAHARGWPRGVWVCQATALPWRPTALHQATQPCPAVGVKPVPCHGHQPPCLARARKGSPPAHSRSGCQTPPACCACASTTPRRIGEVSTPLSAVLPATRCGQQLLPAACRVPSHSHIHSRTRVAAGSTGVAHSAGWAWTLLATPLPNLPASHAGKLGSGVGGWHAAGPCRCCHAGPCRRGNMGMFQALPQGGSCASSS
jgi:hypothetical protein